MFAIQRKHLDVVKVLFQDERVYHTVDLNAALQLAVRVKSVEIVEFLLKDERVDPTVNDNEAIYKALDNGFLEIVKLLLPVVLEHGTKRKRDEQ